MESITYDNTNDDNPNASNQQSPGLCTTAIIIRHFATSAIAITGANDAPGAADAGATLAFTEGDGASVIDATLTLTDVDDTNFRKCHGTDHSWPSISRRCPWIYESIWDHGSYNSTNGTLTLSGTATKAQYETALESVTYNNTSNTPNTGNRTVTWIVNDGDTGSTAITSTITVAVANDAPTVSGNDATLAYTENDGAVLIDSTLGLTLMMSITQI